MDIQSLREQLEYATNDMLPKLRQIKNGVWWKRNEGRDHLTVYVGDNGPVGDCICSLNEVPLVRDMLKQMKHHRDHD